MRNKWITLINRQKSHSDKELWKPNATSVVCSAHFVDGKPTEQYPCPTLRLGYQQHKSHRTRCRTSTKVSQPNEPDQPPSSAVGIDENKELESENSEVLLKSSYSNIRETADENWLDVQSSDDVIVLENIHHSSVAQKHAHLLRKMRTMKGKYMARTMVLKRTTKRLAPYLLPMHKRLLRSDDLCCFYTGIPKAAIFYAICKYTAQIRKEIRNAAVKSTSNAFFHQRRQTTNTLKSKSSFTKLGHENAILLTLMKLRLGLLNKDLAERYVFNIVLSKRCYSYFIDL